MNSTNAVDIIKPVGDTSDNLSLERHIKNIGTFEKKENCLISVNYEGQHI